MNGCYGLNDQIAKVMMDNTRFFLYIPLPILILWGMLGIVAAQKSVYVVSYPKRCGSNT